MQNPFQREPRKVKGGVREACTVSPFSPRGEIPLRRRGSVASHAVSFPRYQNGRMFVCFGGPVVFRQREGLSY